MSARDETGRLALPARKGFSKWGDVGAGPVWAMEILFEEASHIRDYRATWFRHGQQKQVPT